MTLRPLETAQVFFEHRSLEENADGNDTKMWSVPAAGIMLLFG